MKKSDVVAELAKKADISQIKANEYLNAMLEIITDVLKTGDKVTLTGFGTFEVRNRAARSVTDIRTREKRQTPASKHPAFSAGAVLKEAVRPVASKAAKPASKGKTTTAKAAKPAPAPAKPAPAKATPTKTAATPAPAKSAKTPISKPAAKAKSK